jgi:hypothetical protein
VAQRALGAAQRDMQAQLAAQAQVAEALLAERSRSAAEAAARHGELVAGFEARLTHQSHRIEATEGASSALRAAAAGDGNSRSALPDAPASGLPLPLMYLTGPHGHALFSTGPDDPGYGWVRFAEAGMLAEVQVEVQAEHAAALQQMRDEHALALSTASQAPAAVEVRGGRSISTLERCCLLCLMQLVAWHSWRWRGSGMRPRRNWVKWRRHTRRRCVSRPPPMQRSCQHTGRRCLSTARQWWWQMS